MALLEFICGVSDPTERAIKSFVMTTLIVALSAAASGALSRTLFAWVWRRSTSNFMSLSGFALAAIAPLLISVALMVHVAGFQISLGECGADEITGYPLLTLPVAALSFYVSYYLFGRLLNRK